jgi:hypothetical protein
MKREEKKRRKFEEKKGKRQEVKREIDVKRLK